MGTSRTALPLCARDVGLQLPGSFRVDFATKTDALPLPGPPPPSSVLTVSAASHFPGNSKEYGPLQVAEEE